jgi:hypothetical protein
MNKLCEYQDRLLRAAAATDDRSIEAPANARTVSALIKRSLMISVPQATGGSRLLITAAGLALAAPAAITNQRAAETVLLPSEPVISSSAAPGPKGKIGQLIELLRRPDGATILEMMAATGWQAHSIRGAMSGTLKKAKGLNVLSHSSDGPRRYRLEAAL